MLTIIKSKENLPYFQIMDVYVQSNTASGAQLYPALSKTEQLIAAEQELYTYLTDVFFAQKDTFVATWSSGGRIVSALRMEPFMDGFLLSGLETHPEYRGKGFGRRLVRETLQYLRTHDNTPVYSHVDKCNFASLRVHAYAGFEPIMEYAIRLDGTRKNCEFTLVNK